MRLHPAPGILCIHILSNIGSHQLWRMSFRECWVQRDCKGVSLWGPLFGTVNSILTERILGIMWKEDGSGISSK